MRKISTEKIFRMLCGTEVEFLTYIYRSQGEQAAPINFYEAAQALSKEKDDVRRACKRLVESNVLIAQGENFKINAEIFKEQ